LVAGAVVGADLSVDGFAVVGFEVSVDLSVDFVGVVGLVVGFAGVVFDVSVLPFAGGVSARTGVASMARARAALIIVFM
jgi:hypothetical protein